MKTFEINVTKKIKLTEEDFNDILCSCFEGGCGYWCCVDNGTIVWDDARERLYESGNTDPTIEDVMFYILTHKGTIHLIDQEEDDKYYLSIDEFFKGIGMSIENGSWDGTDVCDVDGEVGDVIIQYALFGKLIYG